MCLANIARDHAGKISVAAWVSKAESVITAGCERGSSVTADAGPRKSKSGDNVLLAHHVIDREDTAGLGLTGVSGTGFQSDVNVDASISTLDSALSTLRTQASKFGSNLTTVQVRQDFTKNLITTLQTGADNLVLADTNEEGANLLALQTRQQLSTTALSLANQSNQAVLRLFG